MKRREHSDLPDEVMREFQNGTPEALARAERIWEVLEELDEQPRNIPSLDAAWGDLESRIDQPSLSTRVADRKPQRMQRKRTWLKATSYALATALLLVTALFIYQDSVVVHSTPHGEPLSVNLPDGSQVMLKGGAQLTHKRGFGRWNVIQSLGRDVSLNGEAFFLVEPGKSPFKVNTFNASITVLGTGFNVRAYADEAEKETLVTLDHGKVQVDANGTSHTISIEGESVRVKNSALEFGEELANVFPLDLVLAWRTRGFVAIDLSLESLINEIERRYSIEIEIEPGFEFESSDLIYPNAMPEIEDLLTDFCLSQGCQFQETASGYKLIPSE